MGWAEKYNEGYRKVTRSFNVTKDQFDILLTGFIAGGNHLHRNGEVVSREERGKEARILRALKSVSVEREGARKATEEISEIKVTQKDYELLKKYVESAPFQTQHADEVDTLLDIVSAAKELKDDE